jgi:phosphoglucosamine mutase
LTNQRRFFGTDGIRGRVGDGPVNPDFVLKLGWAVGRVLAKEKNSRVLIGKDTRISGYMFESALQAGLSAAGVDIYLLGPMPTPAVAYLTRTFHAQAGIVISASHNPYHDNGIKFFSAEGTKLPDEIELEIEAMLDQPLTTVDSTKLGKARRIEDAAGRYIEFCKSTVADNVSLDGIKMVVDCAHGATYHIAPNVFSELGAEVIVLGDEPNGFNINLECGATEPRALQKAVLENRADLGLALDGDGDRIIMVDEKGEVVDGDEILYMIARARQRTGQTVTDVVGTQMTNLGLEHALAKHNINLHRAKVGDRYVMETLKKSEWINWGRSLWTRYLLR